MWRSACATQSVLDLAYYFQLVTVQAMRHARQPARILNGHDRPCAVDARRADGRLVRITLQAQMLADDVAHPLFVGR